MRVPQSLPAVAAAMMMIGCPADQGPDSYHQNVSAHPGRTPLVWRDAASGVWASIRGRDAGASSFPFVLYSDYYRLGGFLTALVNSSFSGVRWTPEVRSSRTGEEWVRRMHLNCFSPLEIRYYGTAEGTAHIYDDDGSTFAYETGAFTWLEAKAVRQPDGTLTGTLGRPQEGMPWSYGTVTWNWMTR